MKARVSIFDPKSKQNLFEYNLQERLIKDNWFCYSLSFMWNPKTKTMMDVALWHTKAKKRRKR